MAIVDWAAIRFEYVHTGTDGPDLAARFGVSREAIRKRCSREKWNEDREVAARQAEARAADAMTWARAEELAKFNADDLKIAKELREKVHQMMLGVESPAGLSALAASAEKAQKIGRLALGASTENAAVSTQVTIPDDVDWLGFPITPEETQPEV